LGLVHDYDGVSGNLTLRVMNNGAPGLFKAQWIMSMDEGFWFGCLMLFLLVLVVLTLLSGWLVARLVIDGLLLVLLVDGRLAVAGG
jgi:hypothetical protein